MKTQGNEKGRRGITDGKQRQLEKELMLESKEGGEETVN